jgi:putative FmdB family regulatory protein
MPKYEYKCNVCNHEYVEIRDNEDPHFKVACVVPGCSGTNVEVTG